MTINWHGQSFFEILAKTQNQAEVKIAIDPFGKSLGLRIPKLSSDILLISQIFPAGSTLPENILGDPFLIDGPGEYEVKGIFVRGIQSVLNKSPEKSQRLMTLFTLEGEGIKLCHLPEFSQKELTAEQLEMIGDIDVLTVPVGDVDTLDAKEAFSIISQIEPKIVIPTNYALPQLKSDLDPLDKFLKVMGVDHPEPLKKLKLKASNLPKEETTVVVLQP